MRRHARHVTAADGTPVAWGSAGHGAPTLLLCNGLTTDTRFWRALLPHLERRHRVVTFDLKGHGDSGPAQSHAGASIAGVADDALRVLDAAECHDAVVCGFSMGCQVAVEIHRRAPERVRALALLLGPAGRVFDTALGPVGPALRRLLRVTPDPAISVIMPGLARLGRTAFGPWFGRKTGLVGGGVALEDLHGIVGHWGHLHAPSMKRLALDAARYDARGHLSAIRVPTLVVAGDRDVFAPTERVGETLRAALPQVQYTRLAHGTHASMLEHVDDVRSALEGFLNTLAPTDAQTGK
jgi:pimeloyl-ACP methyl ester carboxylesterase